MSASFSHIGWKSREGLRGQSVSLLPLPSSLCLSLLLSLSVYIYIYICLMRLHLSQVTASSLATLTGAAAAAALHCKPSNCRSEYQVAPHSAPTVQVTLLTPPPHSPTHPTIASQFKSQCNTTLWWHTVWPAAHFLSRSKNGPEEAFNI